MGNSSSSHQPLERGFTRGTFGDARNVKSSSFRNSKVSSKRMDRLRKSFRDSFRRRKERVPEASKPHQWQADETAVRSATCVFSVKYLGCVEVFESRGMQVCEEALKVLRNSRRRLIRGQLHVSGDGLRVVDEDTKECLVDQTIEKVSFCAPDRGHERGFSYICRDGTTRRWMCHGFLASKDSGERLSHAVGCAFAVCLERKQRRDKECTVTMTFDAKNSTFTRTGSFRQQTMTERFADPPQAAVAPQPKAYNPFAIERPKATPTMLERQGSFRGFTHIGAQSPFKRQMSLRINDLPSNTERQKAFLDASQKKMAVSPIPEGSTCQIDTVSELCKELSQGLSLLSTKDTEDFLNFERLANGIISMSSMNESSHIPLPPRTIPSPTSAVAPYRPLVTQANSNNIPIGTATPIMHQSIGEDPSLVPTRFNRIAEVTTADYTSIIQNIANSLPLTSSPAMSRTDKISSPPPSPQKVVPVEAVNPLPKAEQWLTEIAKKTSPAPKRAPMMNAHARSKSLAPGSSHEKNLNSIVKEPSGPSTNPFISPPQPTLQKTFQVKL